MTEQPASQGLEEDIYHLLTKLFYLLDDSDRQFFGEYNLSTRQFWALHHLDEQSGMSMIDLSRLLFTDKSNITAIVDRLEIARLVKRSPAQHDRRVILLTLTPEGRRLHDQVLADHNQRIRHLIGGVAASNRDLINLLEPIRRRLETHLHPHSAATGPAVLVED